MNNTTDTFVLMTKEKNYFVEYLIGELVLSDSLSEAMIFDDKDLAEKFKFMLFENCNLICSVNTFIPH